MCNSTIFRVEFKHLKKKTLSSSSFKFSNQIEVKHDFVSTQLDYIPRNSTSLGFLGVLIQDITQRKIKLLSHKLIQGSSWLWDRTKGVPKID